MGCSTVPLQYTGPGIGSAVMDGPGQEIPQSLSQQVGVKRSRTWEEDLRADKSTTWQPGALLPPIDAVPYSTSSTLDRALAANSDPRFDPDPRQLVSKKAKYERGDHNSFARRNEPLLSQNASSRAPGMLAKISLPWLRLLISYRRFRLDL